MNDINLERLKKSLTHIKNSFFDSDSNMYLICICIITSNWLE